MADGAAETIRINRRPLAGDKNMSTYKMSNFIPNSWENFKWHDEHGEPTLREWLAKEREKEEEEEEEEDANNTEAISG